MGTTVSETRSQESSNPFYGYYAQQNGLLTVDHSRYSSLNMQQLLTWTRAFGHHHLNVMAGHESYNYNYEDLYASKTGAVNYFGNHELGGYLSTYGEPYSYASDYNTEGYVFRAMYDWDEHYFVQASFRRDASSIFHPDNRWGNFWSAGAAWIINKEKWFNAEWANMLKLKVSYGEQGNQNIGYFRYTDLYEINNVGGNLSIDFSLKGNKDISWEKCENFNIGIEFELFKSRLNGSIEFYNRLTRDMLMKFSTPSSLGYSYYYQNVGDMRNRGMELTLSGSPVRTRKVDWGLSLNLTYNHQEVTYLDAANKSMTVDGYEGYQSYNDYFIGEGLPLGTFYIVKSAGLDDKGRELYHTTDAQGNPTTTTNYNLADFHIVKAERPVYGGFGTSLHAYGFDFSTQFTYSIGGKGFDSEYAALMTSPLSGSTGYALHKDILKAWTPENTETDIPRFQYGDEYTGIISDRLLINNSYLRWQNVQIGYTLPARCTARLGLGKLRIYVTGDNLLLWSKRKGYDPQTSSGYGVYSPMRTISGGVNLQF